MRGTDWLPHAIQRRNRLIRQIELGRREILPQMRDRRGAGDQQDVGRAAKQPGERDLHRRGAEARGDSDRVDDCSGVNPPSGKNGT